MMPAIFDGGSSSARAAAMAASSAVSGAVAMASRAAASSAPWVFDSAALLPVAAASPRARRDGGELCGALCNRAKSLALDSRRLSSATIKFASALMPLALNSLIAADAGKAAQAEKHGTVAHAHRLWLWLKAVEQERWASRDPGIYDGAAH